MIGTDLRNSSSAGPKNLYYERLKKGELDEDDFQKSVVESELEALSNRLSNYVPQSLKSQNSIFSVIFFLLDENRVFNYFNLIINLSEII